MAENSRVKAERASLRLDAALKATGGSAGILRDELDQIAGEIKITTTFDDDEVRKGIASLLRFREIQGDVFRDAARLAPDLAVALDIGLTDAYQRLGRALQDPATGMRALRDAGLNVRETQIEVAETLERTGDKAKAQTLILDELKRSVVGAAGAENAGLFGASKALGKAWDDLLKSFGQSETFTSVAGGALRAVTRDVEALGRAIRENQVGSSLLAFATLGAVIPEPERPRQPATGKIRGAPIRPGDFGGETGLQARLREMNELIAFYQKRTPQKSAESPFQNAVKQLEEERLKVDELTRFEEVLSAVQLGRYGKLSAAEKDRLLNLAAAVDLAREDARVQKEARAAVDESNRTQAARTLAEEERLNTMARLYKDLIDPLEKYRVKLKEVDELEARGKLAPGEALEARFQIQLDMEKANEELNGVREQVRETDRTARELGLTFSSAFEDAVVGGKKFSDVLRGLEQDLLRIGTRKLVTEPLANWFTDLLKPSGGAGGNVFASIGSYLVGLLTGKADGGPVSGGRAYIVGEKGPELFVPRMSGAIVPNQALAASAAGSTTINNVTVNVSTPDADSFRASQRQIADAARRLLGRQ